MPRQRMKNSIDDPPPVSSSVLSSSSSSSSSSSEAVEETPKTSTINARPIATKPMVETSTSKKARSKPLASAIKACSTKRTAESEQQQQQIRKEVKRAKRKRDGEGISSVSEEVKKNGEDTKKQLFQRLFTDEDEIAVLKGMLDYSAKKGIDPNADPNGFHAFVKESIHTDVSKTQLMYKIRRLKKRFGNNAKKSKNGEDRVFSKPHEQKIYDLSRKIWGREAGKSESFDHKLNGNGKGNSEALDAVKVEELISSPDEKVEGGEHVKVEKNSSKSNVTLFDKRFGVCGVEEEVLKHGLDMIEGEKKVALEEKWRKIQVAELELFVQRKELVMEHVKLLLEFYQSKDV